MEKSLFYSQYCKPLPPADLLRKTYDYNPETGALFHKGTRCPVTMKTESGHLRVNMGLSHGLHRKQGFSAGRIIWKIVTGRDPRGVIDHINGVRDDNRLKNLRDVPAEVNSANNHGDLWRRTLVERRRTNGDRRRARKEELRRQRLGAVMTHVAGPLGFGT